MSDEEARPTLAGFVLPTPSRALWTTIIASVATFLVLGRAWANLVAIVGAVILTIVLVKQDRLNNERPE